MQYLDFLHQVIERGIVAAKQQYQEPNQRQQLRGSVAGFEACRSLLPKELRIALDASNTATADAYARKADDYWWFRCYSAEVEWVCNVVSVFLIEAHERPIIRPTCRAVMVAAEILSEAQ